MFDSIEWTRPEAFWLLALPIVLVLLTRLNSRPPILATATLDIWKQIAEHNASAGRRSERRVPPSIWLLALSLVAGALAVADPRSPIAPQPRQFTCVVDTSPSMYLPLRQGSRLSRCAVLAQAWLADNAERDAEVRWIRFVKGERQLHAGASLPEDWLVRPRAPESAPRWSDFDQSDTLWLTDQASAQKNSAAVLVASGGEEVPGPVGTSGTARFDWDGVQIVRVEGGSRGGVLTWSASDEPLLASEVLQFARVWAGERGFAVEKDVEDARLKLRAARGPQQDLVLGRDGWSFEGAAAAISPGPGEGWLRKDGVDFLRSSPGLIECGLVKAHQLGGDAASFAVSWGELFDRAVLPAADVIPLSERVGAGEERIRRGSQAIEPVHSLAHAPGIHPAAWLATGAFLLALVASGLASRA